MHPGRCENRMLSTTSEALCLSNVTNSPDKLDHLVTVTHNMLTIGNDENSILTPLRAK